MTAPDLPSIDHLLEESGALEKGHFVLSSGLHSAAYVQCARLFEQPARARIVARRLAELLRPYAPQAVLSPALGGLILGHEVAAALGLPFRFTERRGEEMALRRGFRLVPGERLALVEDVVTTGHSVLETAAVASAAGSLPAVVGAVIDRTGGKNPFPVPFHALLRLDLPLFQPDACPACRAGEAPRRPGSRPDPAGRGRGA